MTRKITGNDIWQVYPGERERERERERGRGGGVIIDKRATSCDFRQFNFFPRLISDREVKYLFHCLLFGFEIKISVRDRDTLY